MGNNEIRPRIDLIAGERKGAARLRRYSRILLYLIGIVLILITLVREEGVIGTWKLSRTEKQLRAENEKLRIEKARLQNEVHKLRTSSDLIEKRAREMGLVYPGEVVIDTRGDNSATRPARPVQPIVKGGSGRP